MKPGGGGVWAPCGKRWVGVGSFIGDVKYLTGGRGLLEQEMKERRGVYAAGGARAQRPTRVAREEILEDLELPREDGSRERVVEEVA